MMTKENQTIKEFLASDVGTEGTLLVPTRIYSQLIEEHDKNLLGRSRAAIFIPPDQIPGATVDINTAGLNVMNVYRVPEAGFFPADQSTFATTQLRPLKYGVRIQITQEFLEDSTFDLQSLHVRLAAKKLAENEDSLILAQLDGATNVVTGTGAITIANIASAILNLRNADFVPDTFWIGPEVLSDLQQIDTFVEADKMGNRELLQTGVVGRVYGMDVMLFSANIGTTTRAYVFDSRYAFVGAEKRPVTVETWKDYSTDVQNIVCSQRIAYGRLRDTSISRITTT